MHFIPKKGGQFIFISPILLTFIGAKFKWRAIMEANTDSIIKPLAYKKSFTFFEYGRKVVAVGT